MNMAGNKFETLIKPNVLVCLAACATLAFGLYDLDSRSLWYDETLSARRADLEWGKLWTLIVNREMNMSLYYILLKLWVSFFGVNDYSVRLPSVFFAVGSVFIIYAVGKELQGTRVGLAAAWLLSVHAFFIYYAQEARGYTLLVLLTSGSMYFFVKSLKEPSWKTWTGFVTLGVLSVYAHLFGALILMAQAASLLFFPKGRVDWRGVFFSAGAIVFCLVPIALFILFQDTGDINWHTKPGLKNFSKLVSSLGGWGDELEIGYFLFGLLAVLFSVWKLWARKSSFETWSYAVIIFWLFLPIVLVLALSYFKPLFKDRYLIISLPAVILMVSVGISKIRQPLIYVSVLALLVTFSVSNVVTSYYKIKKENWRGATHFVLTMAKDEDGLFFFKPHMIKPFDYYKGQAGLKRVSFGSQFPKSLDETGVRLGLTSKVKESLIDGISSQVVRLWLVLGHHANQEKTPLVLNWLRRRFANELQWNFEKKIQVHLYSNPIDPQNNQ